MVDSLFSAVTKRDSQRVSAFPIHPTIGVYRTVFTSTRASVLNDRNTYRGEISNSWSIITLRTSRVANHSIQRHLFVVVVFWLPCPFSHRPFAHHSQKLNASNANTHRKTHIDLVEYGFSFSPFHSSNQPDSMTDFINYSSNFLGGVTRLWQSSLP